MLLSTNNEVCLWWLGVRFNGYARRDKRKSCASVAC